MLADAYEPGKQAMTSGNRYTYANFIDNDLVYSHR